MDQEILEVIKEEIPFGEQEAVGDVLLPQGCFEKQENQSFLNIYSSKSNKLYHHNLVSKVKLALQKRRIESKELKSGRITTASGIEGSFIGTRLSISIN